jgi:ABC-2 type transport system permease protein
MLTKILAIAWNDIKIEFSYRSTYIFFLVLPILFTTVLGLAMNSMYGDSGASDKLALPVANLDEGTFSEQLIETLKASPIVSPTLYPTKEDAQAAFEKDALQAMLVIPAGFTQDLQAGKPGKLQMLESPSAADALNLEQIVRSAAGRLNMTIMIASESVNQAEKIQPFASPSDRQVYYDSSLAQAEQLLAHPPTQAVVETAGTQTNAIASGFEQSSAGQLITWVLITLLGGSEVFVAERQGGTLRRLLTTATNRGTILAGKILGRFLMGMTQMAILIGFGVLVLGIHWGKEPLALAVLLTAFGLAGTSLGVMLGAFARTSSQASNLTTLFSMLLAALGGAWWPLEVTPPVYQAVVKVFPSTWAMNGMTDIVARGRGVMDILPNALVLIGFAALFFVIGLRKVKFE